MWDKTQSKKAFIETRDKLDDKTSSLIEKLRDTVLGENQNGEFPRLGISPAVLTDDFVMRASTFMEIQSKQSFPKVIVGYWFKERGPIKECWLLACLAPTAEWTSPHGPIEKKAESLPLLNFPSKNVDDEVFERILDDVVRVLQEFFPVVVRRLSGSHDDTKSIHLQANRTGLELTAALQRAQELREQGVLQKQRVPTDATVYGTTVTRKNRGQFQPTASIVVKAFVLALCFYFLRAWLTHIT